MKYWDELEYQKSTERNWNVARQNIENNWNMLKGNWNYVDILSTEG